VSTLKAGKLQHPDAADSSIEFDASGNVTKFVGPSGGADGNVLTKSGTAPAWTSAGAVGGLVLITAETFSAVSSVSVNNCFSATYRTYSIVTTFTNTGAAITFRMRSGGSDNSASTYSSNATFMTNWTGALGAHGVNNGTSFTLNATDSARMACHYTIYEPFESIPTAINGTWVENRGGFGFAGYHSTSASFDGFSILGSGMTGIVCVFGHSKSL
jgi:hypothetical protein